MSDLEKFELIEPLEPFKSAKAVLLKWNGTSYGPTNEEIRVFDFIGACGARWDRGCARISSESSNWEVISLMSAPVLHCGSR